MMVQGIQFSQGNSTSEPINVIPLILRVTNQLWSFRAISLCVWGLGVELLSLEDGGFTFHPGLPQS